MNSKLPFYSVPNIENQPEITGELSKGVLIITAEDDPSYDPVSDLSKIMSALGIDLTADAGLIQLGSNPNLALVHYLNNYNINSVLILGANQKQIGLLVQSPLYKWFTFQKYQILFAEKLSFIMSAKERKLKLWNSLKHNFNRK